MTKQLRPLLFQAKEHADLQTEHCFAVKTGALLPFCNRVGNSDVPINDDDVYKVVSFFGDEPFTWFVESTDIETPKILENHAFKFSVDFPAMQLDLTNVASMQYADGIVIKKIDTQDDIAVWIDVVFKSYGISNVAEFTQYINALLEHATSGLLCFYLAFHNNIPAAASMTITYDDIVALHWVGTLKDYRRKGLGFAASHLPLVDAKANGAKAAVLFASKLGEPVYERIGFAEYARYNVYKL